ncbi:hypothetical protein BASA81_001521 [Batrachochytrium salamandrivorans]|nr:hypothetical protein BASA81_001521 [Batrachochytrium salamandrivorans]
MTDSDDFQVISTSPKKRTRQSALFARLVFFVPSNNAALKAKIQDNGGKLVLSEQEVDPAITLVLVENVRPKQKRKATTLLSRIDDEQFVDGAWHVFANWVGDCLDNEELLDFDSEPDEDHNFNKNKSYLAAVPPPAVCNPVFALTFPNRVTENDHVLMREVAQASLGKGKDPREVGTWAQMDPLSPLSRFPAAVLRKEYLVLDEIKDEEEEEEETFVAVLAPPATAAAAAAAAEEPAKLPTALSAHYSDQENAALIKLLEDNKDGLTMAKLASKAMLDQTCPGRTVRSMTLRLKQLAQSASTVAIATALTAPAVSSRVQFTAQDDATMKSWWLEWKAKRHGNGLWGKTVWDEACKQDLFPGKTSVQIQNRFHNRLSKIWLAEGLFESVPISANEYKWDVPSPVEPLKTRSIKSSTPAAVAGAAKPNAQVPEEDDGFTQQVVNRLGKNGAYPTSKVVDALFTTSGNERAARRVLIGEQPDSRFDVWTKAEDDALRLGKSTTRPDEAMRRRFLGI